MTRLTGFASMSLSRARRKIDATGVTFPFDFDQPVIATVVGTGSDTMRLIGPEANGVNAALFFGTGNNVFLAELADGALTIEADEVGIGGQPLAGDARLQVKGDAHLFADGANGIFPRNHRRRQSLDGRSMPLGKADHGYAPAC